MPKKSGHHEKSKSSSMKGHGRKPDHEKGSQKENRHPQKDSAGGLGGGAKIALPKKGCLPALLMLLIPFNVIGIYLLIRS